jgi:beta-galactosidase
MNTYFLETVAELGGNFVLGSDHYYNLNQNWPQNHPTPQYAVRCFLSLEELRLMGFPPTVFEMPGGSASDWPPITAPDALASYMANLAFGMKGFNYYVFTGGQNPPGAGSITELYDYSASIGPTGETRPLFDAQKTFGRAITDRPWLAAARRLCDFRLALDLEHSRTDHYWLNGGPQPTPKQAWDTMRTGPLTTALCAGFSPEMVRLDGSLDARMPGRGSKPLLVVAASSMAAGKQQAIVDDLKAGGNALILPVLPWLDDNLNPCTILSDYLGAPKFTSPPKSPLRPLVAGVVNVFGDVVALWEGLPAGAKIVGVEERSGKPLAWSWPTPGGGTVIVLGMSWLHAMHEQERMLKNLLLQLGCEPAVQCSNPNVWVTVWMAGDKAVVFLISLFSAPMVAEVTVTFPDGRRVDLGRHTLAPVTVKMVDLRP